MFSCFQFEFELHSHPLASFSSRLGFNKIISMAIRTFNRYFIDSFIFGVIVVRCVLKLDIKIPYWCS